LFQIQEGRIRIDGGRHSSSETSHFAAERTRRTLRVLVRLRNALLGQHAGFQEQKQLSKHLRSSQLEHRVQESTGDPSRNSQQEVRLGVHRRGFAQVGLGDDSGRRRRAEKRQHLEKRADQFRRTPALAGERNADSHQSQLFPEIRIGRQHQRFKIKVTSFIYLFIAE